MEQIVVDASQSTRRASKKTPPRRWEHRDLFLGLAPASAAPINSTGPQTIGLHASVEQVYYRHYNNAAVPGAIIGGIMSGVIGGSCYYNDCGYGDGYYGGGGYVGGGYAGGGGRGYRGRPGGGGHVGGRHVGGGHGGGHGRR